MPIQSTTRATPATRPLVHDAIRTAATTTGTSFSYLLATAKVESGLDPQLASPTSSARGLYQFVDQTWLMMLKEAGPSLGYDAYAQAIGGNASSGYEVTNPANRDAVLALRNDPQASAAVAGAFTRRNAAQLTGQLGREPTEGELYIAHFLGAGGAGRLITLAATQPNTDATQVFPAAAAANRSIFYDRSGSSRSALEVYTELVGRYQRAAAATGGMPTADAGNAAAVTPVRTALVEAPVDQRPADKVIPGPMFHSLFQNEQRRTGGVSNFVADLWSTRPQVAAALSEGGLVATDRTLATRR